MYLRHLYPTPKKFTEDEAHRFIFGSKVTAIVSGLSEKCAERAKKLWYRFSCDASELEINAAAGCGYSLIIGNADCSLEADDEYAISVTESGVCAKAKDESSLLNAIKTLVQLICPINLSEGHEQFYISSAEVHDSPAIKFRAIHICIFPDSKLYNIEKAIHLAGFLKLTHLIIEFWGTYQYKCMPELAWDGHSFSKAEVEPLIDLARSYGMEIIPMVNHFGHATQSRSCYGRHVVLNNNPRLSMLFEPDGWTWCLSNPDTYKLLAEMRAEQMELCGDGGYFHLGFDEAYSFATCDKCRKREPYELLSEYLNRLTDDLAKDGRRPIIWHDELISSKDFKGAVASGNSHNTDKAIDLIDKRAIIADWQYWYKDDFNPTTQYFIDKGFDTIVCPWDDHENIRTLSADAKRMNAFGIMLTTWDRLPSFLRDAGYWAGCVWCEGYGRAPYAQTEFACLLRRLYDTEGNFDEAGWNLNEVLQ
ncbi:MAG: family 20 glycosylhydrolase [Clostridiales bacterium]|nr:family 20 glycosylhydrolase [Clostridiales bacterium]